MTTEGEVKMVLVRGEVFVWNPDDWLKLRQEHRIIGNLTGSLANFPRQNTFPGLPIKLLPQEVTLMLEKKIGKLVTLKDPLAPCSEEIVKEYNDYFEKINKEQIEYHESQRKERIEAMIDRIIEGKRRKMMGLQTKKKAKCNGTSEQKLDSQTIEIDREAILKSELQKAEDSTNPSPLIQTFLGDPWYSDDDFSIADWSYPESPEDELKYLVFKDLWNQNYYITSGTKFGGDFLVYPGEPVKFHAWFIVSCVGFTQKLCLSDIIMHSRIGSATRKSFVFASMDSQKNIIYQTIRFAEIA